MDSWISVKDKLPNKEGWIVAKCSKGVEKRYFNPIQTTRFPKGFSYIDGAFSWRDDTVTYWKYEESE